MDAPQPRAGGRQRPARKATERYLDNAARWYVDRYGGTADSLRRALMRRVVRSVREHGTDREEGRAIVERVVQRLVAAGLVDDRTYARVKAAALRRRGDSARQVAAKLRAKGVDSALVAAALDEADGATAAPDLRAAARSAQRRRLGPWRDPARRADRRDRDMAALARQGFSLNVARAVIDAETPEALETMIAEMAPRDGG